MARRLSPAPALMLVLVLSSCGDADVNAGDVERSSVLPVVPPSIPGSPVAVPSGGPGGHVDLRGLPRGWSEMAAPPDARTGAASAWTRQGLLVWGGYMFTGWSDEQPRADGFLLDPETGDTHLLPPSPLKARAFPAFAWTGEELVVWGGWDLDRRFFSDGAAYSPASDEWRRLPDAGIAGRVPLFAWTGEELIAWGTGFRTDRRPRDGAAYDPSRDRWRAVAKGPIELTDATTVWTGDEMIVFGAALHGGNRPESEYAIAASYDPAADEWRRLPDSRLSTQASTAAWNGREMIAWDYNLRSQAYDPERDSWRFLPDVPGDDGECTPASWALRGVVVGDYCGAWFEFRNGRWSDVTDPAVEKRYSRLPSQAEFQAENVLLYMAGRESSGKWLMAAYRP